MPSPRHTGATLAALALLLAATACGERAEPVGPAASIFPVTVTGGDERPVTLTAPVRRIAVLDPELTGMVEAIDGGDVTSRVPVDNAGALLAAELRKLDPELVVASAGTDGRLLTTAGGVTSAPVYVAPASSITEVERAISQLGMLAATPNRARQVVRDIERRRDDVERRVRNRPRVDAFIDLGFFTTASNQTLAGDLLRAAGGRNVFALVADGGPVDLQDLRRADPDVYITTDPQTTLSSLRRDRRTRTLTAVRDGRVVRISASDLAPGPAIGRGLEQLARALHPDAYR